MGKVPKQCGISASLCRKKSLRHIKKPSPFPSTMSLKQTRKAKLLEKQCYKVWLDNCKKLKVPDSVADKWLKCLKNKQQPSGPNRIYHHWKQVVEGKKEFLTNTSLAIILAVVFQYFEYDVKKNCVELNCLEFRKFVSEAKIEDEKLIKTVLKLLGDDSVESVDETEEEMQLFRDIDLAVLGQSTENYDTYARQLRQEYSHMDDASYKQMRLKILKTFLTIPQIYTTEEFRKKFEENARDNIKKEIENLTK